MKKWFTIFTNKGSFAVNGESNLDFYTENIKKQGIKILKIEELT